MVNETLSDVLAGDGDGHDPRRSYQLRPVLLILDGKGCQEFFPITRGETVLGRDSAADVLLRAARVSRLHATILWKNFRDQHARPVVTVLDQRSTNGTMLNGIRITSETELHDGDVLTLGGCSVGFYLRTEHEIAADQALRQMATLDALTGISNRGYMMLQFEMEHERAQRYNRPLSVLMIDIDHFKAVNDTYGHQAGDVVLQSLGRWVQAAIRAHDIAGRYGGEEFAVLLPETPHTGAAILAERLRRMVEATPVFFEGREIRTTISVGVAELQPEEPLAALMMRADRALYDAKRAGRNRVSF